MDLIKVPSIEKLSSDFLFKRDGGSNTITSALSLFNFRTLCNQIFNSHQYRHLMSQEEEQMQSKQIHLQVINIKMVAEQKQLLMLTSSACNRANK